MKFIPELVEILTYRYNLRLKVDYLGCDGFSNQRECVGVLCSDVYDGVYRFYTAMKELAHSTLSSDVEACINEFWKLTSATTKVCPDEDCLYYKQTFLDGCFIVYFPNITYERGQCHP